jgi:hypothetical protein
VGRNGCHWSTGTGIGAGSLLAASSLLRFCRIVGVDARLTHMFSRAMTELEPVGVSSAGLESDSARPVLKSACRTRASKNSLS